MNHHDPLGSRADHDLFDAFAAAQDRHLRVIEGRRLIAEMDPSGAGVSKQEMSECSAN